MTKKNLIEICKEQTNYTIATSRATLDLFCEIMGYPKSNANYFIADDPHGIADIMEGYRIFNMSDIHVVISEYEHWMEIYKTNEELRKAVDEWYYYSIDWHGTHLLEDSPMAGCPNLRSWLAGCPVEGLREATPEYVEQQRKAQESARQRVEECKQALYQAMEEEVKLNKF